MVRHLLALTGLALLAGCAAPTMQTVTITKTVPVYPPAALYDDSLQLGPTRTSGTVQDMSNAWAIDRNTVKICRDDRGALRGWVADMKKAHQK